MTGGPCTTGLRTPPPATSPARPSTTSGGFWTRVGSRSVTDTIAQDALIEAARSAQLSRRSVLIGTAAVAGELRGAGRLDERILRDGVSHGSAPHSRPEPTRRR